MIGVSEPTSIAPKSYKTNLQKRVYEMLDEHGISFLRVDTDEAITMEDCEAINARLDVEVVKTLFLCNRRQTEFYLFVTTGSKPFQTKVVSKALGVARLSFAPVESMEALLGTTIGAATVFSILLESAKDVTFVIDSDVSESTWYGCSDGTTTGYMKLPTAAVCQDLFQHAGREAVVIAV